MAALKRLALKNLRAGILPPVPAALRSRWLLIGAPGCYDAYEPVDIYILEDGAQVTLFVCRTQAAKKCIAVWMESLIHYDGALWQCCMMPILPPTARLLGTQYTERDHSIVCKLAPVPTLGEGAGRMSKSVTKQASLPRDEWFGKDYIICAPADGAMITAPAAQPLAPPEEPLPPPLAALQALPAQSLAAPKAAPPKAAPPKAEDEGPPAKRVKAETTAPVLSLEALFLAAVAAQPSALSSKNLLKANRSLFDAVAGASLRDKTYELNRDGGLINELIAANKIVDMGNRKWAIKK